MVQGWSSLLCGAGDPRFVTNLRGTIVAVNTPFARLLGCEPSQIEGAACYHVMSGRDIFGNPFCDAECPLPAGW